MDPSPSPNSQSDIDIRNKALHLLQQVDPEEKVAVSYAQQARRHSAPFASSYQNSAEVLEGEREANRHHSSSRAAPEGDDWVDVLMPVVSCVSHACKVGLSGIAQQAAAGVSIMKGAAEDRMFTGNSNSMRGSFESVGIPSYQGKYSDIPETGMSGMNRPAGRKTGEQPDIMSC